MSDDGLIERARRGDLAAFNELLLRHYESIYEAGNESGTPFGPTAEGSYIFQWPSVVVIDRAEIVRAVFAGQEAWNPAAVERAARSCR